MLRCRPASILNTINGSSWIEVTMDAVASTKYGRVRGTVEGGVSVFRGVPYAAAPTGLLRFRAPVPPEQWDGERAATTFGVIAPQHRPDGIAGDMFAPTLPAGEDCLTLNVWTPALGDAGLPVLVWIHGGGFLFGTSGDSMIDKGSFARNGVVIVSVNYRLGIDGFLLVDGDPDGGNYGMLDQVAALRWVQENIREFGGDPARVTVAGQSAGATAVGALLAAPSAEGLFARAILQSGYPDPMLSQASAAVTAREVYTRAGLAEGDVEGLRELREKSPESVRQIEKDLFEEIVTTRDAARFGEDVAVTGNPFQPVVGRRFLPRAPVEALHAAETGKVDLLIGHTKEEYRLMYGIGMLSLDMETVSAAFEHALPKRGADALALYRSTRPQASPVELLAALETDRGYRIPATRLANAHVHGGGGKTFFYRFSWPSTAFDGAIGAGHGVELPFVFDALDAVEGLRLTGDDPPQRLADDMHRAWVAFIADGDPSHDGIPPWPVYDLETRAMLEFGAEHRVIHDPEPAELLLWTSEKVDAS